MTTLPQDIKGRFYKTVKGDISLDDFEQWLYADKELEKHLNPDDYLDLISLSFKKSGAKIVFLFAGSDVRSFSHFKSKYDVSHWEFPSYWTNENIDRKRKYVDVAERYSDLIYSVPDQSGLQTKPYYHLQIMVDLKRFTFLNNNRRVPNVLHLPSEPWKKGTDIIEKTINELISEGVKITFFSFRDIPNSHIPPLLRDMDVLVDEIILHGPGVLSFEAMASGCAVATRYLESSPDCFRPPVWNVNAGNLKVKLRQLFEDFELRQKLIAEGRKYVEERNDSGQYFFAASARPVFLQFI